VVKSAHFSVPKCEAMQSCFIHDHRWPQRGHRCLGRGNECEGGAEGFDLVGDARRRDSIWWLGTLRVWRINVLWGTWLGALEAVAGNRE
jgi:hypothetical protein